MTREEQIKFMENATERMLEDFKKNMEKGNIPENWDGIELRWLLRDMGDSFVWNDMKNKRSRRFKDYENHVLVNNII